MQRIIKNKKKQKTKKKERKKKNSVYNSSKYMQHCKTFWKINDCHWLSKRSNQLQAEKMI